jgi:hypothetical protein
MRLWVAALLLLALAVPASALERWQAELLATNALLLVDWGQSRQIQAEDLEEHNPILRRVDADLYFPVAIVLHNAVALALPERWREPYLLTIGAVQVYAVGHNIEAGVRMRF